MISFQSLCFFDINYSNTIYSNRYQELIEQVAEVEVCVARAQSVRHKILGDTAGAQGTAQHLEDLVLRLLDSPEVSLEGGPRGPAALAIRKLFQQARKVSHVVSFYFTFKLHASKPRAVSSVCLSFASHSILHSLITSQMPPKISVFFFAHKMWLRE